MIFTNHSMMTSILRTIEKSPHEMGGCEFDNLISKEKLEEDDDFKDFIDCFVVTQYTFIHSPTFVCAFEQLLKSHF